MDSQSRINVVFVLADQLRADFLGCYGGVAVDTPHIDRVSERGVRYSNCVSTSPLCVPARSSLLTGMSSLSNGVLDNSHFLRPDLGDMGVLTWPAILAEQGYRTASVGKMHFYPWDAAMGFQSRIVAEDKVWPYIQDDYQNLLRRNGLSKPTLGSYRTIGGDFIAQVSDRSRNLSIDGFVADEAAKFIESDHGESPFALMVGFPGPHDPYDPRPESLARVRDAELPRRRPPTDATVRIRDRGRVGRSQYQLRGESTADRGTPEVSQTMRRHYAALVAEIDDAIGVIIDAIERCGYTDNTVVVLSSDHGDHLGDHGFVGTKGTFFESAIRVPLLIGGPSVPNGEVVDDLVQLTDATATILRASGCRVPEYMDSAPLPGVFGTVRPSDESYALLFGALADGWMALDSRWKLHKYATGDVFLFDLESDPDEQVDRSSDPSCQSVLRRMDAALTTYVMSQLTRSVSDRLVAQDLWSLVDDDDTVGFGREHWHWQYPHRLD